MSSEENTKSKTENLQPIKNEDIFIAGVEGGATCSKLIVIDGNGNKLAKVEGPGTNHWVLGMEETARRINNMIVEAKRQLKLSEIIPFECVGLSLSGCGEEKTNNILEKTLLQHYPKASKEYIVSLDTLGSLKTGLSNGGVVLIAGTGSNALLINTDGQTHGCGGWGHLLGDEGSAYWIAHRACKYIFDDLDGLNKAPYPITYSFNAMKRFFYVNDRRAMLPHFYSNFDKSSFAMFAKVLAVGCEDQDPLCLSLFEEAGRMLAKHVEAVSLKAHNDLKNAPGGLKVICVGSVWKSWNFLKTGFTGQIEKSGIIDELTLLSLTTSAAVGACYLAADKLNLFNVKKTYENNTLIFYHYNRKDSEIPCDKMNSCLKNYISKDDDVKYKNGNFRHDS